MWISSAGQTTAGQTGPWYSLNGDKVLYLNIHLYMIRHLVALLVEHIIFLKDVHKKFKKSSYAYFLKYFLTFLMCTLAHQNNHNYRLHSSWNIFHFTNTIFWWGKMHFHFRVLTRVYRKQGKERQKKKIAIPALLSCGTRKLWISLFGR